MCGVRRRGGCGQLGHAPSLWAGLAAGATAVLVTGNGGTYTSRYSRELFNLSAATLPNAIQPSNDHPSNEGSRGHGASEQNGGSSASSADRQGEIYLSLSGLVGLTKSSMHKLSFPTHLALASITTGNPAPPSRTRGRHFRHPLPRQPALLRRLHRRPL